MGIKLQPLDFMEQFRASRHSDNEGCPMSHIYDLKLSFIIDNVNDATAKAIVRVMLFFLPDKLMHREDASMRSIPTTSKSLSAKLMKLSSPYLV